MLMRLFRKLTGFGQNTEDTKVSKRKLFIFCGTVFLIFGFAINSLICLREGSFQYLEEIVTYYRIQANTQKNALLSSSQLAIRILADSTSTSDSIQKYILLLIIIFFVVVPVTAILIFVGLLIYKKCQQNDNQAQQNAVETAAQINLDSYNIDELGPYIANSNDNCSICLDNKVNVRTFCGHFFHATCLKTWIDKKAGQNMNPTCPVCVGRQTNPVKVYCKNCFVSVKLDIILISSTQQSVCQIDSTECNQCKKTDGNNSFSQSGLNDNPEIKSQKQPKQEPQQEKGMKSNVKLYVNSQI